MATRRTSAARTGGVSFPTIWGMDETSAGPCGRQAVANNPCGDLRAGVQPQLSKNVAHVCVGGPRGDHQCRGDLGVRPAFGDQHGYFALPTAEPHYATVARPSLPAAPSRT